MAGGMFGLWFLLALPFHVHAMDGPVAGCSEDDLLSALDGGGYVTFSGNCSITVTAPIEIYANTTIDAQGYQVTISGGNQTLVFVVDPGVNFTNIGLTITGGQNTNGGGFYINQSATVVLTNCTLSGNNATNLSGTDGNNGANNPNGDGGPGLPGTSGASALGGAVYNLGSLTLLNCALTNNSVAGGAGGNGGNGGNGDIQFSAHQGGNGGAGGAGGTAYGGAIYNLGTLLLSNCTVSGNSVIGGGGGVGGTNGAGYKISYAGSGGAGGVAFGAGIFSTQSVTVLNCTFAGNVAQGGNSAAAGSAINGPAGANGPNSFGGGIWAGGAAVTNCTFFNNTVTGGNGGNGGTGVGTGLPTGGNGGNGGSGVGGGLYSTGIVSVLNCTFANCQAIGGSGGTNGFNSSGGAPGSPGSVGVAQGGGIASGAAAFWVRNTLFSTNFVSTSSSAGTNIYAVSGKITDGGYNLSSDNSSALTNSLSIKTNFVGLGPLANNGGSTMTMGLLAGSPAINAAGTNAATFPPTDQRGVPRPMGTNCDIGAYELVTAPVILVQPQNQPQTYGGSVVFTVSVVGDVLNTLDSLRYRWQLSGTNILGGVTPSYTVPSAVSTNFGPYRVIITNNYGSVTSSVAYVQFAPYIFVQPTNTTVLQGDTTNFFVTAGGDLTPYFSPTNYQWQFNGTNIAFGATNPIYTVFGDPTNAGTYTVAITNAYGAITSAPAILTVGVLPFIRSQSASQVALVGANATFSVTADGSTPLDYTWYFNSTPQGGISSSLIIPSVSSNNAGTYYVVVHNSFGITNSTPATLTVVGSGFQTDIIQPGVVSNKFSFTYQRVIGVTCVIEFKTNLTDPSWIPLATNSGTGGLLQFTDTTAVGLSRFYRILFQ